MPRDFKILNNHRNVCRLKKLKKKMIYKNKTVLGSYLAGLWEGDGSTAIKNKNYAKPSFHITFHMQQLPYAKKLLQVIARQCKASSCVGIPFKKNAMRAI